MKRKNDYTYILHNNNTRVMIFKNDQPVTDYSKLPPRFIEEIARKLELYLYEETSYYTGRITYKAGKLCNDKGGVINLYTTESRAAFNRFVCGYVNVV